MRDQLLVPVSGVRATLGGRTVAARFTPPIRGPTRRGPVGHTANRGLLVLARSWRRRMCGRRGGGEYPVALVRCSPPGGSGWRLLAAQSSRISSVGCTRQRLTRHVHLLVAPARDPSFPATRHRTARRPHPPPCQSEQRPPRQMRTHLPRRHPPRREPRAPPTPRIKSLGLLVTGTPPTRLRTRSGDGRRPSERLGYRAGRFGPGNREDGPSGFRDGTLLDRRER